MKKKRAVWCALAIAVVAASVYFIRQSDDGGVGVETGVRDTPAEVNVPAPDAPNKTSAEARVDEPLPVAMLDRALDRQMIDAKELEPISSTQIPKENAIHYFLEATELLTEADFVRLGDVLAQIEKDGLQDRRQILELLNRFQPALDAIRKGVEIGHAQLPPPRGPDEPFPHLAKYRMLGRLMCLQAALQAEGGDTGGALDTAATVIAFGCESSRGGSSLDYLFGCAVQQEGVRTLCDLLQSVNTTPEMCQDVLARLQYVWQDPPSATAAAKGNAEASATFMKSSRMSPDELAHPFREFFGKDTGRLESMTDDQRLGMYEQAIAAARETAATFDTPYYQFKEPDYEALFQTNPLSRLIMYNFDRIPKAAARLRASRGGVALVAALEKHRREQGAYPDALDALAGQFQQGMPIDPFTGNRFLYRREGGSYRLYTAGYDGKDNGGAGNAWDREAEDFVIHAPENER